MIEHAETKLAQISNLSSNIGTINININQKLASSHCFIKKFKIDISRVQQIHSNDCVKIENWAKKRQYTLYNLTKYPKMFKLRNTCYL